MANSEIFCLGSVNADFQLRVPRPLGAGSTLPGTEFVRLGGGKAANRAVLARRLGVPARLIARVGADDLREQALAPLRAAGVDLGAVTVAADQATGVAMIAVLPDGRKVILFAGNANEAWDAAADEGAEAAVAGAPPGSVLALDFEVPAEVALRAARAARVRGIAVVIDPSPPVRTGPREVSGATAVTPNPEEAEALTGTVVDGPEAAAAAAGQMRDLGVGIACVKLAGGGCVVAAEHGFSYVPPLPVQAVVDSTGAGDAFAGALAVALLERRPPLQAALLAVAASSLAVTAYGSQPAYPDRARLEAAWPALAPRVRDLGRA